MRTVAFRGLFARKMRIALTALSVALGVCLISGTYIFTDTINSSFDRIFSESAKGTDAAITPRKPIDTSQNGGTQPVVPASVLAKVRAQPRRPGRAGLGLRRRHRARQGRRAHRRRRRAELHRLRGRRAALRRLHRQGGAQAANGRRGDDRRGHRRQGGLRARRQGVRRGRGAAQGLHDRRHYPDRRGRLLRRRGRGRPHCWPRPSGCSARTASTRSRLRPARASPPRRCATRSSATSGARRSSAPARRRPATRPATSRRA